MKADAVPQCRDVSQVVDFPPTALTAAQYQCLELLFLGLSVTQAARKLGVDRRTIQRWRSGNPHFQSEYNRRILEATECSEQRLRRLSEKAVSVIERHLDENSLAAATSLLKIVHSMPKTTDTETNPHVILKRQTEKLLLDHWHASPFAERQYGYYTMENKSFLGLAKEVYVHQAKKYGLAEGSLDEIVNEITTGGM